MGMIKEFKEFAMKGSVLDMAVGIIIGGGFGKIVSSVVSDIIMPPVGLLISGVNFTDLKIILKQASLDPAGNVIPEVALNYGSFVQTVFDFLIVAFAIFLFIKAMNSVRKKEVETPVTPPAPTKEEELLTEIRDLLKNGKIR